MAEDYFAGVIAERYDEGAAKLFTEEEIAATIDVLADLAGDGPALEFAIGTGRIGVPLAARGISVSGIELSPDMAAQLRAKQGADAIRVEIGDMATTKIDGEFALVYLIYNTIMNLTSQDEQVACFRNAAAHLMPGGCFVIEVHVPDLQRLPFGETVRPFLLSDDHLGFDEYDVVRQGLVSHHYLTGGEQPRRYSMPFRYVWPAELDLMAKVAGMTLHERWANWQREPFTATSTSHVSVWRKA